MEDEIVAAEVEFRLRERRAAEIEAVIASRLEAAERLNPPAVLPRKGGEPDPDLLAGFSEEEIADLREAGLIE